MHAPIVHCAHNIRKVCMDLCILSTCLTCAFGGNIPTCNKCSWLTMLAHDMQCPHCASYHPLINTSIYIPAYIFSSKNPRFAPFSLKKTHRLQKTAVFSEKTTKPKSFLKSPRSRRKNPNPSCTTGQPCSWNLSFGPWNEKVADPSCTL